MRVSLFRTMGQSSMSSSFSTANCSVLKKRHDFQMARILVFCRGQSIILSVNPSVFIIPNQSL